ncbi:hypothetical protein, partial [Bilophila wadsworthia]|uniref:hypothetical protein n=1 Tax=Bilophila wadsworthia TaxID=35833 RepID=UPI00399C875D
MKKVAFAEKMEGMRFPPNRTFTPGNAPIPMSRTLPEQGFNKHERLGRGRDGVWGREGEAACP